MNSKLKQSHSIHENNVFPMHEYKHSSQVTYYNKQFSVEKKRITNKLWLVGIGINRETCYALCVVFVIFLFDFCLKPTYIQTKTVSVKATAIATATTLANTRCYIYSSNTNKIIKTFLCFCFLLLVSHSIKRNRYTHLVIIEFGKRSGCWFAVFHFFHSIVNFILM